MQLRLLLSPTSLVIAPLVLTQALAAQQQCATGSTRRLTIVNKCGDDVWAIETPPGKARSVQAQWDWFKNVSSKQNQLPNGGVVAGLLLKAGSSQDVCVPDRGAPGGNFRFYMGCPDNNGNPFDIAGCRIGAAATDLAAINTLFEPTFGCRPTLSGKECAFNPAGPPDRYPDCAIKPGPDTCPAMASADNFDISAVDGYTIPMRVDAQPLPGYSCNRLSTDASMLDLASCPTEDGTTLYSDTGSQEELLIAGISLLTTADNGQTLKACVAPYKWLQTASLGSPVNRAPSSGQCDPTKGTFNSSCFYSGGGCDASDVVHRCPNGSGPQQKVGPLGDGTLSIQNTHWVQDLYAMGYRGYTWQYGDEVGDQSCDWGETVTLTLCPRGGVPYRAHQLWTYSQKDGNCIPDGSTGTPDDATTFSSLAACQKAIMRYTCESLDSFEIPAVLWAADPRATIAGTGFTYDQVQASRQLSCSDFTVNIPGHGSLTLPECNYVYAAADVCPTSGSAGAPQSTVSIHAAVSRSGGSLIPVSLIITNNGALGTLGITLTQIGLRTLAGTGQAALVFPSPPIVIGLLKPGASAVVNMRLQVPSAVTKMALRESGSFQDGAGTKYEFSPGQVIFP